MKNRGSILILSLWALSLISVFALTISVGIRQKLTLWNRLNTLDKLETLCLSGVERAKAIVGADISQDVDTLTEDWALRQEAWSPSNFSEGALAFGDKQNPGIRDEERKINLNFADSETLQRLFKIVLDLGSSEAQALAFCILDWRDQDSNYGHPQYGAEDDEYEDLKLPYECKDARFEFLDELLLVKGMNRDIFNQLKPWVTVYGSGTVNVNTASEEVLIAVGLNQILADKVLRHRRGPDKNDGGVDDLTFLSAENIAADMSKDEGLITETEMGEIENLVSEGKLGVSSAFYSVEVQASLKHSPATMPAEFVIKRDGRTLYARLGRADFHKTSGTETFGSRILKSK